MEPMRVRVLPQPRRPTKKALRGFYVMVCGIALIALLVAFVVLPKSESSIEDKFDADSPADDPSIRNGTMLRSAAPEPLGLSLQDIAAFECNLQPQFEKFGIVRSLLAQKSESGFPAQLPWHELLNEAKADGFGEPVGSVIENRHTIDRGNWHHECRYSLQTSESPNRGSEPDNNGDCRITANVRYTSGPGTMRLQSRLAHLLRANCSAFQLVWSDEYELGNDTFGAEDLTNLLERIPTLDREDDNYEWEIRKRRRRNDLIKLRSRSINESEESEPDEALALIIVDFNMPYHSVPSKLVFDFLRKHLIPTLEKKNPERFLNGSFRAIGDTGWLLRKVPPENPITGVKTINLGIMPVSDLNNNESEVTTLLPNAYYLTDILKIQLLGDDEATVYFIAAPSSNFSLRHLYRQKVVYPPVEYPTLEPIECLTCPPDENYDPANPKIGQKPECLWAEAVFMSTSEHYLFLCRGPGFPWSALVDAPTNQILELQEGNEFLRDWGSTNNPTVLNKEFEIVGIHGSLITRARLYYRSGVQLSPVGNNHGKCFEKLKLILKLPNNLGEQLVHAKYQLTIAHYLVERLGYLVLEADVQGSKYHELDTPGLGFEASEAIALENYQKTIEHVLTRFKCVDSKAIGVFGEAYGGHLTLKLLSRYRHFGCGLAVSPSLPKMNVTWRQFWSTQSLENLRGQNFAVFTSSLEDSQAEMYGNALLGQLTEQKIAFEHKRFSNLDRTMCNSSRARLYEGLTDRFALCFRGQK